MVRAWIVLVVVGLVAACGASRPACPAPPTPAPGPAFLWKVERAASPPLWLFGTIHDANLALVPEVARAALDHAAQFASELGDGGQLTADQREELAFITDGPGLDQTLGDDWYDLRDELRGRIAEKQLARAKPWFALILLNREGAPRTVSMDTQLGERARDRGIAVSALETPAQQIRALDRVVTVDTLRRQIRAHHMISCEHHQLIATYARGDLAAITPLLVVPATADELLYARNRAWLPALESLVARGGFVAVGLGHMLGEQGLPALLAARGYTVTRVTR